MGVHECMHTTGFSKSVNILLLVREKVFVVGKRGYN